MGCPRPSTDTGTGAVLLVSTTRTTTWHVNGRGLEGGKAVRGCSGRQMVNSDNTVKKNFKE